MSFFKISDKVKSYTIMFTLPHLIESNPANGVRTRLNDHNNKQTH